MNNFSNRLKGNHISVIRKPILQFIFLFLLSLVGYGQSGKIEKTITPYKSIYESGDGVVQMQFLLFPCNNQLSDRKYGFNNTILIKGGRLTGKFDYELCNGGIKTERFTVYLDKRGEVHDDGDWIQNTNHIVRIYDIELYDPRVEERKRQQEQQQLDARRQEQERQEQDRIRQEAEQRKAAEERDQQQHRQEQERQDQRQAQENREREVLESQRAQQKQQRAEEQRKRDEAQQAQANIDQINRTYQAQSAAISDAAQAIGQLASLEKDELTETHDFIAITGGITNLISPFLTSNRTNTLSSNPLTYYGSMHLLNRGIISINATISGAQMKNDNFAFYGYTTAGGQAEFSGTLEAKATAYQLSIGKDFVSKDGRFHFYLAPMLTYWASFEHSFKYTGNQTYIQKELKDSQFLYGLDSQIYWFFDETFGLNAGIKYNLFASESKDTFYYKPTNFASWNIGLSLRLF